MGGPSLRTLTARPTHAGLPVTPPRHFPRDPSTTVNLRRTGSSVRRTGDGVRVRPRVGSPFKALRLLNLPLFCLDFHGFVTIFSASLSLSRYLYFSVLPSLVSLCVSVPLYLYLSLCRRLQGVVCPHSVSVPVSLHPGSLSLCLCLSASVSPSLVLFLSL